ncbi:MAG: glycoside hydrolase family 97 N-terminal domain-containing protein, partial [Pseudomonadota bacterium]
MRKIFTASATLLTLSLAACIIDTSIPQHATAESPPNQTIKTASVSSPSNQLSFSLSTANSQLSWQADWRGETIVTPSALGLIFKAGRDLDQHLKIASVTKNSVDQTWEQPWGERQFVRDHHNELVVEIIFEDGSPAFTLRARVYDDGLGFRYEVPDTGNREITDELTEFRIDSAAKTWWIPAAGWNRYEELYHETKLDSVPRAHTPMTLELPDQGPFLSIHEAALVDYAGMWLNQRRPGTLEAELAPWSDGTKVKVSGAFKTPWRTVQVSDTAAGLANS